MAFRTSVPLDMYTSLSDIENPAPAQHRGSTISQQNKKYLTKIIIQAISSAVKKFWRNEDFVWEPKPIDVWKTNETINDILLIVVIPAEAAI